VNENLDKAVQSAEELSGLSRTQGALLDDVLQAFGDSWLLFLRAVQAQARTEDESYVSAAYAQGLEDRLRTARNILGTAPTDLPIHELRWLRAFLDDQEFPELTPEEPEPGRDWTRVEACLFNANGKYKYRVFLDYTGLRHQGVQGEGPSGWHYDGAWMAREALRIATENGTSEVTFKQIPTGWRLFVADPPQGYPHYAVGEAPEGFVKQEDQS
jgi:hypothetical protein